MIGKPESSVKIRNINALNFWPDLQLRLRFYGLESWYTSNVLPLIVDYASVALLTLPETLSAIDEFHFCVTQGKSVQNLNELFIYL